jgi:hypothetical protein
MAAALAGIAWGASSLRPGTPWGPVDFEVPIAGITPGSGEDEGEESALRAEAAGSAAADDDDAALAQA